MLVHFKNDCIKGPQALPLSKGSLQVVALLDQASAFMHTKCREPVCTLFFSHENGRPFKSNYFSTIAANVLSMYSVRCTANTFRHMFVTAWKDFISSPNTQLLGLSAQQLETVAASMMLNSPEAWAFTYDDSTVARGMHIILSLWPRFLSFVYGLHLDRVTEKEFDPATATMAELSLE